jgi:hypothetical protein
MRNSGPWQPVAGRLDKPGAPCAHSRAMQALTLGKRFDETATRRAQTLGTTTTT